MRKTPKGRNELIFEAQKSGKSLREIGKIFGISHERVRQILAHTTIHTQAKKDNLTAK